MKKIIIDIHKFGPLQEVSFQVAPFHGVYGYVKAGKELRKLSRLLSFHKLIGFKKSAQKLIESLIGKESSGSFNAFK